MLVLILVWVVLVVVAGFAGNAILACGLSVPWVTRTGDRLILSVWLGLLFLCWLLLGLALLTSLTPWVILSLALPLALWSILSNRVQSELMLLRSSMTLVDLTGVVFLLLGVGAYCSMPVNWFDTGLYHFQVIKWLSEHGIVFGLANLHSRLGFFSSWFTLPAVFNHGPLYGRVAALPNGLVLLLLFIQGLIAGRRVVKGEQRYSDLFVLVAIAIVTPLILYLRVAPSPSPDLVVSAHCIIVCWVLLVYYDKCEGEKIEEKSSRNRLAVLWLAILGVPIKLAVLPVVGIVALWFISQQPFSRRRVVGALLIVAVALLPFCIANVKTSGFPLYPLPLISLPVNWKMDIGSVTATHALIKDWAHWGGMLPAPGAKAFAWFVPWLTKEPICAFFLFVSIIAFIGLARQLRKEPQTGWIAGVGVCGILFFMLEAPTLRFCIGYFIVIPALWLANRWGRLRTPILGPICESGFTACYGVVLFALLLLHIYILPLPHYQHLADKIISGELRTSANSTINPILPPGIISYSQEIVPSLKPSVVIRQQTFSIESGTDFTYLKPGTASLCWDAPLPCSPDDLNGVVMLRTPSKGIAGGFRRQ